VKLTGEFISLEEPTDDSDIVIVAVFPADGSDFVESKRQVEPKEPTQKFRLPIVRSISRSKLAKTGVRVGV
jgi:pyruvate/oxaloacetate carboxyltransferase